MYISEEQKMLEKIDADFKKHIQDANELSQSIRDSIKDYQWLEYAKELDKVRSPNHRSNGLRIRGDLLSSGTAESGIVFIPEGISKIRKDAFDFCFQVAKVILPEGLRKIDDRAFADMGEIYELCVKDPDLCYPADAIHIIYNEGDRIDQFSKGFSEFPNTLEEIGDNAFEGLGVKSEYVHRKCIEYLVLPKSLKRIGKKAFYGSGIQRLYFNGAKIISRYCFQRCYELTKVIISKDVSVIEKCAFAECRKLEEVVLGHGLKEIGEWAFDFCLSLKKVVFPDSLEKIGKSAFDECGCLTNIEIPDSVTEIGENAFSKCKDLKKVKIGKGLTAIPECCFSNCSKLKEIIIPDTVIQIAQNAFKNCSNFTIIGNIGSSAEQFAKENNIKFEAI